MRLVENGGYCRALVPDLGHIQASVWNHIIVGILLKIADVWVVRTRSAGATRTLHWLAAAAGAWLLIASFTLGLWNDSIVGVIVVILGLWAALAS